MAKRRTRYEAKPAKETFEPAAEEDQSGVYARGQTVIPKRIREALAIEYGSRLHWELREGVIHVIPIPKDPVAALYGIMKGKGPTYEEYLAERNAERERERQLEAEQERRWRTYSTRRPS
jgi:AbrB family looped-hinge helix DNA binding protein